jgi:hypothetical protein
LQRKISSARVLLSPGDVSGKVLGIPTESTIQVVLVLQSVVLTRASPSESFAAKLAISTGFFVLSLTVPFFFLFQYQALSNSSKKA